MNLSNRIKKLLLVFLILIACDFPELNEIQLITLRDKLLNDISFLYSLTNVYPNIHSDLDKESLYLLIQFGITNLEE